MRLGCVTIALFFVAGLIAVPYRANASVNAGICEAAASLAAEHVDVPERILQALTLTETGRTSGGQFRPWPWAINHSGEGHWFQTQQELMDYARGLIASGETNFDVGCFQLNYRWHAMHFASLDDMTNPLINARYAAGYLLSKYRDSNDWAGAVGAYHSATQHNADRYLNRFVQIYAALGEASEAPRTDEPQQTVVPRTNPFPLLIAGQPVQGPSLVPQTQARARLLGGQ